LNQEKFHNLTMKIKNLALIALLLLLTFLAGFNLVRWLGYSYITVTGTSRNQQMNEKANFTVSVSAKDEEKSVVNQEISDKSEEIVNAIRDFGVKEENIQTTNVNIYQVDEPVTVDGQTTYEPGDWQGRVSIEIVLKDTSKASDLTELLSSLDISNLYGPQFSLDRENIPEARLLESAYEDAYDKAEKMAKSLGKIVDKTMEITEAGSISNNRPGIFEAVGMGGGGADIPMEPGSSNVSKTVTVRFRLK
jgi:uncharacterized protein YggE